MPKTFGTTALVEVRDENTTLNLFIDLREQEDAIKSKIDILKPIVSKLVKRGNKKNTIDGVRNGRTGKFFITIVPRDLRKPSNDKVIELLLSKGITAVKVNGISRDIVKMMPVYDREAFAQLMQDGTLSREEILSVMEGSNTSYPRVKFKPVQ